MLLLDAYLEIYILKYIYLENCLTWTILFYFAAYDDAVEGNSG